VPCTDSEDTGIRRRDALAAGTGSPEIEERGRREDAPRRSRRRQRWPRRPGRDAGRGQPSFYGGRRWQGAVRRAREGGECDGMSEEVGDGGNDEETERGVSARLRAEPDEIWAGTHIDLARRAGDVGGKQRRRCCRFVVSAAPRRQRNWSSTAARSHSLSAASASTTSLQLHP